MSTQSDLKPVYIEFPDFGYGPASAILALLEPILHEYEWHIVSTGAAARFASLHLPNSVVHDLDTFDPDSWSRLLALAPAGSTVVSVTNPHFAGWAAQHGYRAGVIDTLDWMWDSPPPGIEHVSFHLVQSFFGAGTAAGGRRQLIDPIVDPWLWAPARRKVATGSAVVSFGGMTVPSRAEETARYVRWLTAAVLPVLVEVAECEQITIIGARADLVDLLPLSWQRDPRVTVIPGLDRAAYARRVTAAQHVILAPGLAGIHECAAAELTPMFQPGFNMSMILQSDALVRLGYRHVATWPDLAQLAGTLRGVPELVGLKLAAEVIDDTIGHRDPAGRGLAEAAVAYVRRSEGDRLRVPARSELADGRMLLAQHLGRLG